MKYSLLVVILIKYVEDTSMQGGGGKEYMHTLDHSIFLHFSSVMLNFFTNHMFVQQHRISEWDNIKHY